MRAHRPTTWKRVGSAESGLAPAFTLDGRARACRVASNDDARGGASAGELEQGLVVTLEHAEGGTALTQAQGQTPGMCDDARVEGGHLEAARVPFDQPIYRPRRAGRGQGHEDGGSIEARVGPHQERQRRHRPGPRQQVVSQFEIHALDCLAPPFYA